MWSPSLGAWSDQDGTHFRVWAPTARRLELVLESARETTNGRTSEVSPPSEISMVKAADGTFSVIVPGVGAGNRYRYRVDGQGPYPDPASRFQPEGVHGPSQVIDPAFAWTDGDWRGRPLEELVIYELHVGTFSPEGTFAGAMARLSQLADLGVTAV